MAQENNNQSEIRYLNPVSVDVKKKKYCRFKKLGIKYVDYKDGEFLKKFLNEQGKILPRRLTGTSQKFQKKVAQAVKRARHLAAHICKDELLFQLIVHIIVDDAAGEGVEDIAPETGAGLFQTRFHFFLFFFFVFLAKSEEPHGVLLSFSLIYIRKPALRQPVPDQA